MNLVSDASDGALFLEGRWQDRGAWLPGDQDSIRRAGFVEGNARSAIRDAIAVNLLIAVQRQQSRVNRPSSGDVHDREQDAAPGGSYAVGDLLQDGIGLVRRVR